MSILWYLFAESSRFESQPRRKGLLAEVRAIPSDTETHSEDFRFADSRRVWPWNSRSGKCATVKYAGGVCGNCTSKKRKREKYMRKPVEVLTVILGNWTSRMRQVSVSRCTNVSSRSRLDKKWQRLGLGYLRLVLKMAIAVSIDMSHEWWRSLTRMRFLSHVVSYDKELCMAPLK